MKRINKRVARRLFDEGKTIIICACKLRPGGPLYIRKYWNPEIIVNKTNMSNRYYPETIYFDRIVRDYEWYNCTYETGYYSAFYIN